MRIIKPGNKLHFTYRGRCYECGCEIECEKGELQIEYDRQEHSNFARYACPNCNRLIILYPIPRF